MTKKLAFIYQDCSGNFCVDHPEGPDPLYIASHGHHGCLTVNPLDWGTMKDVYELTLEDESKVFQYLMKVVWDTYLESLKAARPTSWAMKTVGGIQ